MVSLLRGLLAVTVIAGSAQWSAADHHLTPLPAIETAIPMAQCVKVKDPDHIAPCAVPMLIQVPDPCACNDPCNCCGPKCVGVEICVPNCGCPTVKVRRDGNYVKYDYGDYAVEVTVRKGYIVVDYDD